jgi:NADP-dependent aldehyde dehydrogenase
VYAEMSSVNPVIVLPSALEARGEALATGFVNSLTLGVGQFCTNPGLVLLIDSPAAQRFADAAAAALSATAGAPMLNGGILAAYERGVTRLCEHPAVTTIARGQPGTENAATGALFTVRASAFLNDAHLSAENFGPSSLIVLCADEHELLRAVSAFEGQLTATLHLDPRDHRLGRSLLPLLERKAGRILANGWPTGVEVSPAMVHGGPYPATSDARSTSVGTRAIERFLRPVCYQDLPSDLLPAELRDDDRPAFRRMVDGRYDHG